MPYNSGALATLRPELGSLFEFDLEANRLGLIGYRVLPIMEVAKASGTFGRIPAEQLGKLADVVRSSKGDYNRVTFAFDDDTFATKEYGLEAPVDKRNANLYKDYFDAEMVATRIAMHMVLMAAEVRVANAVFNTSTFTGSSLTTAISTEWSTVASSTPITDVFAASQKVRDNCGQYANALICSRKVFRNLQRNASIIDRIQSYGAGSATKANDVTPQMVAACLDLEQVIVADSSYDNAKEGQTTTFTDVWDDEYAMVCRVARTNSIEEAALGRTFHWSEDGSQPGGLVETYDSNTTRGTVVRVRHEVHEKIIYPECGHLLSNITA